MFEGVTRLLPLQVHKTSFGIVELTKFFPGLGCRLGIDLSDAFAKQKLKASKLLFVYFME